MQPFVVVALRAIELMGIADKAGQGIIMRFCKLYAPEKIGLIIEQAKTYPWWEKNPKAAFMKAVGFINQKEKSENH